VAADEGKDSSKNTERRKARREERTAAIIVLVPKEEEPIPSTKCGLQYYSCSCLAKGQRCSLSCSGWRDALMHFHMGCSAGGRMGDSLHHRDIITCSYGCMYSKSLVFKTLLVKLSLDIVCKLLINDPVYNQF
jgi:hypothetical protein